jgi:hypothetical protein
VAFGISLVATLVLQIRARKERRESRLWQGFRGEGPMDLTGLEQLNPSNYTPAGQKPYKWFVVAYLVTVSLGLALLLA